MPMDSIIVHYGEIGLKGKNRGDFERALQRNIERAVNKKTHLLFGRLCIPLSPADDTAAMRAALARIPGVTSFSFAREVSATLPDMQKTATDLLRDKDGTFRIDARRAEKTFPHTSQELNEQLGAHIVATLGKKVKLDNPDTTCFVEVVHKSAFLYTEKIPGVGGLPVGSAGMVVALLSGGIDSPVAAWYAMKRGAKVIFLHFHSMPYTSPQSLEKVAALTRVLSATQGASILYSAPLADAQKEIVAHTDPKLRVILYRRMMFRVAEIIARQENALALVTGESLGQVASQTLENIAAINDAVSLPVLRPLIGMDKTEIIEKARTIGTYDLSVQPHDDCCSLFLPEKPATRARLERVRKEEAKLDREALTRDIMQKIEKRVI